MYKIIKNPINNKNVNLFSNEGISIIQKYLYIQEGKGKESTLQKKPICINSVYGKYCKSPTCIWSNDHPAVRHGLPSMESVCYPEKYWNRGSVLNNFEKRDAYVQSYIKNKNLAIEIQSSDSMLSKNNVFIEIGNKIGEGFNGEIYDIELFESKKKNKKIELSTPICMKITGINSNEIESDKHEFDIGLELAKHNIGPAVYDYISTKDLNVIPMIIYKLQEKQSDIVEKLADSEFIRIIIMQKLDGHTLYDTHYYEGKNKLTKKNKNILCKKITKMHELGFIHNDLHQDNIFIDKKEPYIIDFGYSQKITENDGHRANFMINKDGTLFRGYGKTLGNQFHDNDDNDTKRKQYCKKADWSCERGYQGEITHQICSSNYNIKSYKNIDKSEIRQSVSKIVQNNQSGYIS